MKSMSVSARLSALAVLLALCFAPLCAWADGAALAEGADLRVMSYNIMHPDWSHVPVKGRDEAVAAILTDHLPDVAALQEAGAKWHKALIPLLMDNGLYAPACRQSNAEGFIYCTTTFLYNPKTLRLIDEYILDLDRRDAARVLSVAVFERISGKERFVVANTHPAPRDQPENYARNMADLQALAAGIAEKYAGLPLIFMGDFNTPEDTDMYTAFMQAAGVRDAKYEADTMINGCSTWFGYREVPDPEDTRYCVDHIFVSPGIAVKRYEAVLSPGVEDASDHLPIYADVCLVAASEKPGE